MWSQRQTPSSSIAASETFGCQPGPTYGNRFRQDCLASQQPSTKPRSGSTPSTGSTPSAGHRMGRGKGALASPLRLRTTVLCARLRLKNQRRQLGAPDVLHAPGATRLSKLAGCALSRSVFSLWQSPHSACKVCTLPAKACLTGTTWSSSQAPVSPQPHSAHLPSCAARVFYLSAAPGTSRFAFSTRSSRPGAG